MATAVLEDVQKTVCVVKKTDHLKPWQFQPGHAPINGGGRPKGSKSFSTILVDAAPRLAKSYLREALKGSAPLLQDARKMFMPIDDDAVASPVRVMVFIGDGALLPRNLTDAADAPASRESLTHAPLSVEQSQPQRQ